MLNNSLLKKINQLATPFYYYDLELLNKTLTAAKNEAVKYNYHVHYALKANSNPPILKIINEHGFGADCVSGNEIKCAIENGFETGKIVFAGVGKNDAEIEYALDQNIFCFNCESIPEIQVINQIAAKKNKIARIALRLNPNVDASTHTYITTGLEENKFGINTYEIDEVLNVLKNTDNLKLCGLHFHIGSQITSLEPFKKLCARVNEFIQIFNRKGIYFDHINVGGGLGINYKEPDSEIIVDFKSYFSIFNELLFLNNNQQLHFELGRSLVANCGSLISRVLYVKKGINTDFAILDAGMTELIRPALYQAYHKIESMSASSNEVIKKYDIVGPICESSDCFGKAIYLPQIKRGDFIRIRSTGAYGEVMSSQYNLRDKAASLYSNEL